MEGHFMTWGMFFERMIVLWLIAAGGYFVLPLLLTMSSVIHLQPPLVLTHAVLAVSLYASGRLAELGVRKRQGGVVLMGLAAFLTAASLMFITLSYCPQ